MSSEAKPMSKKKEGFLRRQVKSKLDVITEEELLKKDVVAPEDVLRLAKPTESKRNNQAIKPIKIKRLSLT